MNNVTMIIFTVLLILIFIPLIFIPYWTRKTESFGVSIPEEVYYNFKLETMRKKYAKSMLLISLVVMSLFLLIYFFISKEETFISIIYGVLILVYFLCSFLIYFFFHQKMKRMKASENWAKDKAQQVVIHTRFHQQNLTISNWLYVIPFIISLVTIIVTLLMYNQIPEQIPMHYNFTGEVTRWATKSYGSALLLPITQLFLNLTLLFINFVIANSKQQVSAVNP